MNRKMLFALWGGLFIVCGLIGFIPEPAGAARVALTLLAFAFFLPPAYLLWQAKKENDDRTRLLVRNISALSLGLTLVLLVLNFLSVFAGAFLGDLMYYMLVMVSSPMICSGNWALSLFLWACLLMASLKKRK